MSLESLFLVMAVVWIGIAFAVGSHASGQGKSSMWGLAVFLFGMFGLIGYAISLASD